MEIKTVKCSVCGEIVSKKKTLAVGDGQRACRTHENTQQQAKTQQNERKAEEEQRKQAQEARNPRNKPKGDHVFVPKCSCCQKEGLQQQEYFMQILLANKRYELEYGQPLSIFDNKEKQLAYRDIRPCLWLLPYDSSKMKLPYPYIGYSKLSGLALLCDDCCKKFGIDPRPKMDMQLEDLSILGYFVDEVLEKIIAEEGK